jgi:hypothetical protein
MTITTSPGPVETFVTEVIPVLRRTYPSRVWVPPH